MLQLAVTPSFAVRLPFFRSISSFGVSRHLVSLCFDHFGPSPLLRLACSCKVMMLTCIRVSASAATSSELNTSVIMSQEVRPQDHVYNVHIQPKQSMKCANHRISPRIHCHPSALCSGRGYSAAMCLQHRACRINCSDEDKRGFQWLTVFEKMTLCG